MSAAAGPHWRVRTGGPALVVLDDAARKGFGDVLLGGGVAEAGGEVVEVRVQPLLRRRVLDPVGRGAPFMGLTILAAGGAAPHGVRDDVVQRVAHVATRGCIGHQYGAIQVQVEHHGPLLSASHHCASEGPDCGGGKRVEGAEKDRLISQPLFLARWGPRRRTRGLGGHNSAHSPAWARSWPAQMEQKGSHPRDSHSTATAGPALAPQDPNRMHSRRVAAPKTREAQIRRLLASKEGPASPGTRALADDRDAWREAKRAAASDAAEREKEELKEQMREASLEARMREEARQRDLEAKREARRAAIEVRGPARHGLPRAALSLTGGAPRTGKAGPAAERARCGGGGARGDAGLVPERSGGHAREGAELPRHAA